ncbi:MAG: hypothetical protein M0R46_02115 [Candidatus Muirbacterium halophilum]|nr:hypothetical protein [Candidatus Muirbacterium halophilum]MCK9474684.1 hypothetical protein [Candidatus Muirbacterium halophilum]
MKNIYLLLILTFSLIFLGCGEKKDKVEILKEKIFHKTGQINIQCDKIAEFEDNVCGFSNGKIFIIKDNKISKEENYPIIERKQVLDIIKISDKYLIATNRGIIYKNNSLNQISSYKTNCFTIINGKIYAGTENGIVIFDNNFRELNRLDEKNSFFKEYFENKDISERLLRVNAITDDGENIYIGTDEGLIITDYEFNKAIFYYADYFVPSFSNDLIRHKGNSPLAGSVINSLKIINNNLYIGTNSGITIYNHSKKSWQSFISKDNNNAPDRSNWKVEVNAGSSDLPGNFIRFIDVFDKYIIAGTNKGLSCFSEEKNDFIPFLYNQNVVSMFKKENILYLVTEFDGIHIFSLMEVEVENSNRK